ncbi:MAG TPA: two-component sensor histidine kinase [Lachnospiraceae bacterium]|nr:two-component sensor histidine kinase [Lachnospiraceae bacterium]
MKRAIFKKFIVILSLVLFLSGSIFSMAISDIMLDKTRNNLLYTLRMADFSIDYQKNLKEQVDSLKAIENEEATRFTILDFEGNVLADSNLTDYTKVENHSGREEIKEALKMGEGYAKRYSDTMRIPMLYVSCLSGKGDYILRIAVPFSGLLQYTGMLLPAILFSIGTTLGISILLANQFARSITKPLMEITEELRKLKEQNPEFHFKKYQYEEMNMIADTIMEMSNAVKESMKQIEFERMVRQEFFSNASHELKTPITSVRGYVELLENGLVTDEGQKKEFLARIKKETQNMTNLINDILMISRLETKEAEVVLSKVRVCPLVSEVCTSLEPLAKQCDVTIEMNCRPIVMTANTQQLKELFTNLINNAIKYNKPGGKVSVTVTTESDEVIIVVEDTGVGIPEESKQRVFERFYRVDKGRSKKMGGTGLGLSIVKHVVNYYNGTIHLESTLNIGSKFTVRLPKNMDEKH